MASVTHQALLTAGGGAGATATAFLARTSGLDATHVNAYTAFLNGLDADSLTAKFDMLHIYATQDSTTALLNLVSVNYNGTANGSPAFVADRGFTGIDGSITVYIDTNFLPSSPSAGASKYTRNSGHISAWVVTNVSNGAAIIGAASGGGETVIYPRDNSGNSVYRIQAGGAGFASANASGYHLASRLSSVGGVDGYRNGASVGNLVEASQVLPTANYHTLGYYLNPNPIGNPNQQAAASIGVGLSSAEVTLLYNRLRTYMTAVGVP